MTKLESLFSKIEESHYYKVCTNPSEFDSFESQLGYSLPGDLRTFYQRYRVVKLFVSQDGDTLYRFIPIEEIRPARWYIYGKDTDEYGPSTWLAICDVQDGNYIALDTSFIRGNEGNYIDCFHETFGEPGACMVVAKSFTELLERTLDGSETGHYYLEEIFQGYGDGLELTPENAIGRIENPDAPKKTWVVRFYHNKRAYHAYFDDIEYGGRESSYRAAKEYFERNSRWNGDEMTSAWAGRNIS